MTAPHTDGRPEGAAAESAAGAFAVDAPIADEYAPDVRVLDSELVHRGHVWDVRSDRFEFGGAVLTRDYVDHTGAVGVLAIDDADRVLLLRQYRHAIAHRDWEIPAGLMDLPNEPGLAAAQRELAEEADLQAEHWHLLLDIYTSPGGMSETLRIFIARGLSPAQHDFVRDGEEAEMVVRWVPLDEAVEAALAGRVQNGVTTNALLAAEAARSRGWRTLRDPATPWDRRALTRGQRSE